MKKFIKKTLCVLLTVILLLSSAPMSYIGELKGMFDFSLRASAQEGTEEATLAERGQCGDNVFWTFDEETGVLTLSGTGATYIFNGNGLAHWAGHNLSENKFYDNSKIKSIIIENGITEIGANLFSKCSQLSEVNLPGSLNDLGYYAFGDCSNISKVSYTGTIEQWCNISFYHENSNPMYYTTTMVFNNQTVTEVVIPDSISKINSYAFYNFADLKTITIPETVTKIGSYAFCGCSNLENINIPESVTLISSYAFKLCKKLSSINLPQNLKNIQEGTFYDCQNLLSIDIPSSIVTIGKSSFYNCSALTSITIPDHVTSIGECSFSNCKNITKLIIPNSVTTLGREAFSQCSSIETIVFSDNISKIPVKCFEACSALKEIIIPNNITQIDREAFSSCSSAKKLILSKYIKTIDEAFPGCHCDVAYYEGTIDDWLNIDFGAFGTGLNADNFYISGEKPKNIAVPNTVTTIQSKVFVNFTELESIIIPDSVIEFEEWSFGGCSKLKTVNYLGTVGQWCNIKRDGSNVGGLNGANIDLYFNGNSAEDIVIPKEVSMISECTFTGCKNIKNVTYEGDILEIGDYAFRYCVSLETITSNDCFYISGKDAFSECHNLKSIKLSDDMTTIPEDSFWGCSSIKQIRLPQRITTIGWGAFRACSSLESIIISESLISFGKDAFWYSSNLSDVFYCGTEDQWNEITGRNELMRYNPVVHYNYGKETGTVTDTINWSFNTLSGKLSVEGSGAMPSFNGVKDTGWYYFINDIEYIDVSDGISNVGANAFNGCRGLREVYLGDSATAIGDNAFSNCSNLSLISITSNDFSAENAFDNNNPKTLFITSVNNSNAKAFAQSKGYNLIEYKVNDVDKVLAFKGNTVVYGGLQYIYLTKLINKYSDFKFLHFDRLEFDGISPDVIIIDDCENIDTQSANFALTDLYVSLRVVADEKEEQITFEKMFELLNSGNYDAFKLVINSNEEHTEETFFQKVVDAFINFTTDALRVISKAINFITSIFKKK